MRVTIPRELNGNVYAGNNSVSFSDPTGLKACVGIGDNVAKPSDTHNIEVFSR